MCIGIFLEIRPLGGDDSKWFSALFMALNNFARREFMHLPPRSLVQRNQDYHR